MKLAQLLDADRIVMDMQATELWPALIELVDHLVSIGRLPVELYEPVLHALWEREQQVSTGIGSGVAIPHTFSDEINEVVTIFGRSTNGIDFQAIDNEPVHYIILFIVPSKDYQLHLFTLSAIAKLFTNCEVRRVLGLAKSKKEILEILSCKPSRDTTKHILPPPPARPS
ncbi:MAG: PTS sugar transporter subunit IIA [Akkermansiaceae bacterium]|nr:PTS sugar transporter subunit IIA [Akkermansiaceae bacterium]